MKHTFSVTLGLISLFLIAQIVGLVTISRYVDIEATSETGQTIINEDKYIIAPPEVEESSSFIYIGVAILIGTLLALLIVKFNKVLIWKSWFFLSVFLTLSLGFWPYVELFFEKLVGVSIGFNWITTSTLVLALLFTVFKFYSRNFVLYNFTEIFIYSGIAALLVPILNYFSASLLLVLISLYDFWAVFRTKHMVSLAKFQSSANLFAGFLVPYKRAKVSKGQLKAKEAVKSEQAILGGGDIAFPLLFAGVVLKSTGSFFSAFIVSFFSALALLVLFLIAKKKTFYPAMPFIAGGCLLGWFVSTFV